MKFTSRCGPAVKRTFLRLIWHSIPFVVLIVVVVFVIVPLGRKITEQKAGLAEQRSGLVRKADEPARVITLEMVPDDLAEVIRLPGMAMPWKSLEVVAEVSGRIMEKNMDDGTVVAQGEVLAVIDRRDYQNAYDSARASYETARMHEQRFKALSKQQFVTQSQLDDVSSQVKTTRAAMETAKLNLDRCTIRSPMSGVVDRSHIETGSFLGVGDPVARILQIDPLKIQVGIPESDVASVRNLTQFDMTVDALDGKIVTGEYHYLQKTTDSLARLYNLEIRLENPGYEILPDMFVRVAIVKNRDEQGLAVPMYSLITRKGQTGVFVADQGIARFAPVDTGFQDGWKIQVTSGLSPGDQVVVVGHRMIEDKDRVHVDRRVRSMSELGAETGQ
ncbi:efflux RND transporter periplasmic adaptor subunit [Desulfotignum phosphitoxidans]|uniref:Multidrug resistance protein MexA n=1 Tax=Desulfotignum phosphitoxidans DSM 13687 TaxID=1286635 RepID=S0FV01_9BACT|nr:efflux RND transporter periplasmic adaptor subunit [Desulfotignum phosphitoxidans]EMS78928.1 multidrug resistance protein MexA [Desulfotignum phosphitoxidans DSM 13687]